MRARGRAPNDLLSRRTKVSQVQEANAADTRSPERRCQEERWRDPNLCMRQMQHHHQAHGASGLVPHSMGRSAQYWVSQRLTPQQPSFSQIGPRRARAVRAVRRRPHTPKAPGRTAHGRIGNYRRGGRGGTDDVRGGALCVTTSNACRLDKLYFSQSNVHLTARRLPPDEGPVGRRSTPARLQIRPSNSSNGRLRLRAMSFLVVFSDQSWLKTLCQITEVSR
jgi:hypothetical protein